MKKLLYQMNILSLIFNELLNEKNNNTPFKFFIHWGIQLFRRLFGLAQ